MTKTKMDPLEAAKITDARMVSDDAKLSGKAEAAPKPPELRADGPTIEDWVLDGHHTSEYPPEGFAEKPSAGLTRFKASGRVSEDFLAVARAAREPQQVPAPVLYVVQEEARVNVGGGQFATFKKGHVLDRAGYGDIGIQRLVDQGLKLERQKA